MRTNKKQQYAAEFRTPDTFILRQTPDSIIFFSFYFSLQQFGCFVQRDMMQWLPEETEKFGLAGSRTSDSTFLFKSNLWIHLTHPPLPPNLVSLFLNEHNLVILSNETCRIDFLNKQKS
jgi:hypothetical protein